jgi:hypothetical protein
MILTFDPRPRRRRVLLLAVLLVAALAGVGGYALRGPADGDGAVTAVPATLAATPTASTAGTGAARSLQDTYVSVLERVRPSVVEISTGAGLGSGVVYDDKGHIVPTPMSWGTPAASG